MPCPINLEGSAKNIKITLHHHEVAHSLYLCLSREATVAPEVGGKAILIREYGTEENYPFKENQKSWTMKHLSCSPFSSHQNCVYRDRIIRKVGLRLETFRMPDGNLSNNHSASSLIYLYSSCEKNTQVGKKEWEKRKHHLKLKQQQQITFSTFDWIWEYSSIKLKVRRIKISQQRWQIWHGEDFHFPRVARWLLAIRSSTKLHFCRENIIGQ